MVINKPSIHYRSHFHNIISDIQLSRNNQINTFDCYTKYNNLMIGNLNIRAHNFYTLMLENQQNIHVNTP